MSSWNIIAKVYKYPLDITDEQTVKMHQGARLLSAQMQNGVLCLWALCDLSAPMVSRTIYVHGTGHEVRGGDPPYVGTVLMMNGGLVWHVFDGGEN